MVDTDGRALLIGFSEANIDDSAGGAALLKASRSLQPFVKLVWADSSYQGSKMRRVAAPARVAIVTGIAGQKGFVVQPRRWVVERSFVWPNRSRRLWRVCEAVLETISAMTYAASVFLLMRRTARDAE